MKTVILAGGKGTRLKPYTTVFPKPLMPIGDKPILEIVIRQLKSCGLEDIIVTVGHLGELIVNFFGDGSKFGVNIKYSREDEPLGTAGGLGLIKSELTDTFLMINGDTLTTLNFTEFVNHHKTSGAIGTIALNKRQFYFDFGVPQLDSSNSIKGYLEKPTFEYLVSMGVYVFEPKVLKYIRVGEWLEFPDLVKTLIANGEDVRGFIYDGYWLDIGRPEDYEKANEEIEEVGKMLNIGS
jgi:NDP-sugar pyrophosphorylase family protein